MVCAAYLARAGISVTVVEARQELGGPAGAFQYMPGFQASMTNSPGSFENTILEELELEKYGLRFFKPAVSLIHPFEDETFVGWRDKDRVDTQLDHYAAGEAARYRDLIDSLNALGVKSGLTLWSASPPVEVIHESLDDSRDRSLFDELVNASLKDFLDSRLKSNQAKALFTMLAVNGQMLSPKEPGSGIGLLLRPISMASTPEADSDNPNRSPLRGSVGLPLGSMSAIINALWLAGKAAGVEFLVGTAVKRILTEDGVANGVELEGGRMLRADAIVSTVEPSILFNELLDEKPHALGPDSIAAPKGSAFKIALALDGLPEIRNLPDDLPSATALQSQFRIGPSPEYIEDSIHDAIAGRPSRSPIMWGLIPSLTSPGISPDGKQLLSVNVWHAPHDLGPEFWATEKETFGRRCIDLLEGYLPGLSDHIVDHRFLSPVDLADELRLTGSNITHGDMVPARLFGNRPHQSMADYGTGVTGLFMGGAGVWPGGYVTGAPGKNAAAKTEDFLTNIKVGAMQWNS